MAAILAAVMVLRLAFRPEPLGRAQVGWLVAAIVVLALLTWLSLS